MLDINFLPFPTLTTEHLILRQLEMTDDNEILALRSDERVNEFIDRPKTINIEEAREFINKINDGIAAGDWIYWAITQKIQPKLIGTICYWNIAKENFVAEIGYELHPDYQGKGIMQEAFAKVLKYGFQSMGLKMIEGYTNSANERSSKLLEKYNFKRKMVPGNINTKEVVYWLTKTSS